MSNKPRAKWKEYILTLLPYGIWVLVVLGLDLLGLITHNDLLLGLVKGMLFATVLLALFYFLRTSRGQLTPGENAVYWISFPSSCGLGILFLITNNGPFWWLAVGAFLVSLLPFIKSHRRTQAQKNKEQISK